MKLIVIATSLCTVAALAFSSTAFADPRSSFSRSRAECSITRVPLNPACGTVTVRMTRLPVHTTK